MIQNTIRKKFKTCTVLTIAHRLNTVMESNRVIVLDAGKIVEFDHPYNLLKNKNGFLYSMVDQTGPVNADLLHKIASEVLFIIFYITMIIKLIILKCKNNNKFKIFRILKLWR